jgi:hypothetical protein
MRTPESARLCETSFPALLKVAWSLPSRLAPAD